MTEYDVVCENLCKNFGDFEAVKNFNFKVERGEYIAFLGPSGCGKSTTLRCIAGHNDITSGSVFLRGKKVNERKGLGDKKRSKGRMATGSSLS